ncbi:MAG: hypothetical protein U0935_12855 [Pirellulales bacterium]
MAWDDLLSTRMSVLQGIASPDESTRRRQLEAFCTQYTPPLVSYLCVTRKATPDDAPDVVSEFWLRKVLSPPAEGNLVAKYLRKRERCQDLRFRAYLCKAIQFFLIDYSRSERTPAIVSIDQLEGWEPVEDSETVQFDRVWANHLLCDVLRDVRDECLRSQQAPLWRILETQVLRPAVSGAEPLGYAELARNLGFHSPKAVSNAMLTVRRKITRVLAKKILAYLPGGAENPTQAVDEELAEVLRMLEQPGGLLLQELRALLLDGAGTTDQSTDDSAAASFTSAQLRLAADPRAWIAAEEDLEVVWQQVLDEPLEHWLSSGRAEAGSPRSVETVRGFLLGPRPPLEQLEAMHVTAKRYGNAAPSDAANSAVVYPTIIAALVYMLAIALAELHHGRRISGDSPDRLLTRVDRLRDLAWIGPEARKLLLAYRPLLDASR